MVVGMVVEQASAKLRKRVEAWAAGAGSEPDDVSAAAAAMVGADGEVAETVQYEPPPGIVWDDATYTGSAYPTYGWAACLVDVAVDTDTYEVRIERCVHAVDVGKAINPVIVEGQIEGGTLQALGWALLESVVYGDGRVRNASMTDCIVPTFADAPELETIIVEIPYAHGPHGAKGVGEIPMDGPAAAVADAVGRALGVDFDSVPVLPERIQEVVEAAS
jgi:CO/xanthine dehydrogenase Mo-binding subunit